MSGTSTAQGRSGSTATSIRRVRTQERQSGKPRTAAFVPPHRASIRPATIPIGRSQESGVVHGPAPTVTSRLTGRSGRPFSGQRVEGGRPCRLTGAPGMLSDELRWPQPETQNGPRRTGMGTRSRDRSDHASVLTGTPDGVTGLSAARGPVCLTPYDHPLCSRKR